jgi:NAD-dependent deacetylase
MEGGKEGMGWEGGMRRAAELLSSSRHAVALTGAGVSTESGIPDFRSPGGLWSRYDPSEFATLSSFLEDPSRFYLAASEFLSVFTAEPNQGHRSLARLEEMGLLKAVITQNVDGLHQAAGSKKVVELHGNLRECRCLSCGRIFPIEVLAEKIVQRGEVPPLCGGCGGLLKPNVVFFGESLPGEALREAFELVRRCDLLLVAGSSLVVSPANFLPPMAVEAGAGLLIVNEEPTPMDAFASVVIRGKTGVVLPELVERVRELRKS